MVREFFNVEEAARVERILNHHNQIVNFIADNVYAFNNKSIIRRITTGVDGQGNLVAEGESVLSL